MRGLQAIWRSLRANPTAARVLLLAGAFVGVVILLFLVELVFNLR